MESGDTYGQQPKVTITQHKTTAVSFFRETFGGEPSIVVWTPGRAELLGNHTDYNLGRVLGVTINRGILVAARLRKDERLVFASITEGHERVVTDLECETPFQGGSPEFWVNYPVGVLKVLFEKNLRPKTGAEMAVWSNLPEGAGLGSSAALEIASALVWGQLYGYKYRDRQEVMQTGLRAEREFVGVPCGMLDQATVVFGGKDHIVSIDCKTETSESLPFPKGFRFWIFNTNEKHLLIDSYYAERHLECLEACQRLKEAYPEIKGLCDLDPNQLEGHQERLGAVLWKRSRHVTEENSRVLQAIDWLSRDDSMHEELGELLYQSHASSRIFFENSTDHLDLLVDTVKRQPGVIGARLTGGGFGGAVLVLTGPEFGEKGATAVAEAYRNQSGQEMTPFSVGTCAGAYVLEPET